jgi:hypothetical protein
MAERTLLTSETTEGKLKQVDIILQRLIRKYAKASATVVMPLVPLSFAADITPADGIMCRVLCPMDCTIQRAYVHVEEILDKAKPMLTIQLKSSTGSQKIKFPFKVGLTTASPQLEVKAGTRIIVSTTFTEALRGVSLGLAVTGIASQALKEQVLLDKLLEEQDARETEEREA